MAKSIFFTLIISSFLFLTSCGNDPVEQPDDYTSVLENISRDVILSTYQDLQVKSQWLADAMSTLASNPSEQNLNSARQAWRDARLPWEKSEGFLFGPVDQQGIDPSIDSWPVNETDLEAVLQSGETLTKSYIDGLDGTLKGFHTIEYLLFGTSGNKLFSEFDTRQFEYLKACSASLLGATTQLYNSWNPAGENFIANLEKAGQAGQSIYPSQKSALQEIVTGMVTIADEVANGKINDPFSQQDLTLEESRFSANSKSDFADNIRSIQNVYLGTFNNAAGEGISAVIKSKNASLDGMMRLRIESSIQKIEAIEGTFTSAIFNAPQSVITAQNEVRNLQQLLESEVLPIITNL
jgi:putative iron-regulated protein